VGCAKELDRGGPSEDFALFYSFPLTILFKWQEVGWAKTGSFSGGFEFKKDQESGVTALLPPLDFSVS